MNRIGLMLQTVMTMADPSGYTAEIWTTDHGLPQNSVTAMATAADGFLWLATWGGPVRFDGRTMQRVADDLPVKGIVTMLAAGDGTIWLGTLGGGLVRWHDGAFRSWGPAEGLSGTSVNGLAEDAAGRLWVGTEQGVDVLVDGRARGVLRSGQFGPGTAMSLERGAVSGVVRAVSEGRLCVASGAQLECGVRMLSSRGAPLTAVHEGRSGRVWLVYADAAIARLDGEAAVEQPRCRTNGCVPEEQPRAVLEARDGSLWLALRSGRVARVRAGDVRVYGPRDGLPVSFIRSLHEDPERGIWIGTDGAGLVHLRPRRVAIWADSTQPMGTVVRSIAPGPDGGVLAASTCGMLRVPERGAATCGPVPGVAGEPTNLVAAGDGTWWVGILRPAVVRWSPEHGVVERLDLALHDAGGYVRALQRDRQGTLWIGTTAGVFRRTAAGDVAPFTPGGRPIPLTAAFLEDATGHMWIASNAEGLASWDGTTLRSWGAADGLTTRLVQVLHEDRDGRFWVGTSDRGLFQRRGDRFIALDTLAGLPDRTVTQILEDDDGHLWVGTNRGIARLHRDEVAAWTAGRLAVLSVVTVDREDGMLNGETTGGGFHPSGLRDARGRLWFSTVNGLVRIDPASFPLYGEPPRVHVTGVRVEQQATLAPDAAGMLIPPGARSFEVLYTAIGFTSPRRMRFRYRLVGFSDEWVEAGDRRVAYFTRMAPGRYTFEVAASSHDGAWLREPVRVPLTVQPLWWETGRFRLAVLLAIVLLSAAGGRWAAGRRHRRRLAALEAERRIEDERRRIARDLHDDLGARLTRIGMLADVLPDDGGRRLSDVARAASQAMDELVWLVDARNDTIRSFAEYAAHYAEEKLHESGIGCAIHLPPHLPEDALPADLRRHLFLVFKEALNNAVKHAAARRVEVRFGWDEPVLSFEVVDDGRGFDPDRVRAGSDGLRNMRERMTEVGGRLELDAGPDGGVHIRCHAPVRALAAAGTRSGTGGAADGHRNV